jgi:hypothetical protein
LQHLPSSAIVAFVFPEHVLAAFACLAPLFLALDEIFPRHLFVEDEKENTSRNGRQRDPRTGVSCNQSFDEIDEIPACRQEFIVVDRQESLSFAYRGPSDKESGTAVDSFSNAGLSNNSRIAHK